ncbi:MAG: enoyl-CoA hydratase-related protein [Chloroflexia bacterium]
MPNDYRFLTLSTDGPVAIVTLNRPEVHNAFNAELIEELRQAFEYLAEESSTRVVVLAGEGRSFCAGADVNWMRASLDLSEAENVADALRMARMFDTINRCPRPVIGRVHGAALGGGVGLAAVCDVVVAADGAVFGLSEVKLGIAPAVISPYVLAKIGRSHARALFLTGERFGADRAQRIGLVHHVVTADGLDAEVERICGEVLTAAPHAISRAKTLIERVPDLGHDEAMQYTAETIAALRTGTEGQDGLRAFLERRKPGWAP